MKPYQEVVTQQYADGDVRERQHGQYALTAPLGALLVDRLRQALVRAIRQMQAQGLDLATARALDVGCGWGLWARDWAELLGEAQRVTAVDLSPHRLVAAARINPGIRWLQGDACHLPETLGEFDFGSAIVMLMHLQTGPELDQAWEGFHQHIRADGWLLVYERTGQDHDAAPADQDHAGFLHEQLLNQAKRHGFQLVHHEIVFRQLRLLGHSAWLIQRGWPLSLVTLVEKFWPGTEANTLFLFRKIANQSVKTR